MIGKLVATGLLIVALGRLLRGHDTLTGAALILLFLVTSIKLVLAVVYGRRKDSPPYSCSGTHPPFAPVPIPPARPVAPELSATAREDPSSSI